MRRRRNQISPEEARAIAKEEREKVVESKPQNMERKAVLLVNGRAVGEVQVRGIFDSQEEAYEFADEELGRGVTFEIQEARYY